MSEASQGRYPRRRIALVLTFCAGAVDAAGYLAFDRIFVSHVSGNTVEVAVHASADAWLAMVKQAWPIPMFLLGVMVASVMHELGERRGHPPLRWLLAVELVLLGALLVLGEWAEEGGRPSFFLGTALGAVAMGLQNASLRRAAGVSFFTTHVTGTITKLGESLIRAVFWLHEARRESPRSSWRELARRSGQEQSVRSAALMAGLWVAFLVGAVAGALLFRSFRLRALLVPLVLLGAVAVFDSTRPVRPRE